MYRFRNPTDVRAPDTLAVFGSRNRLEAVDVVMESCTQSFVVTPNQKRAIVLLIRELMNQLNELASLRARGYPGKLSSELFAETCSVLHVMEPELQRVYLELFPRIVGLATAPKRLPCCESYEKHIVGPRRRFIAEIRESLESRAA